MNRKQASRLPIDPRTKMLLLVVMSMIALTGYQGWIFVIKPYFFCLPFCLLAVGGKPMPAFKLSVIYLFFQNWEKFLFFLPQRGGLGELFRLVAAVISSFMPCLVMGYYVVSTTKVSEFIASMQQMRISSKIIIPFAVLFRFFPTISEEYRFIQDAMRMRGIGLKKGPVAMMEYRMVPLMISLVKIGDDLSASAATRGLSIEGKRTTLCRLHFGALDFLLCLLALAILPVLFASV